DRLRAMAVPGRAAGEVAADRDPHDHRAGEAAVGAPPHGRRLAPQRLHGRPDVVEELDLGGGAQSPDGLPDGPPDDVGLGQRGGAAPGRPEGALQPVGGPEDAALARDVVEPVLAGGSLVLAEYPHAIVARHNLEEGAGDGRAARKRWLAVLV